MTNNTMSILKAATIVWKDQRESYPDFSFRDALEYAYNTVDPELINDDDETAEAYRVFINWRSENGPVEDIEL